MQDFEYVAAKTIDEVVSLLSKAGDQTQILSGGTDLIVQLREGRKKAALVVDIKHLSEVTGLIFEPGIGVSIGAALSCQRICTDPGMIAGYPGLIDAFSLIGGTQIQGRASVGGNLCNASPAADAIPALIVHEARCLIVGPRGRREMPVDRFCTAPGKTELRPGEFLLAVLIPPVGAHFGASYMRFIPRNEMDIAVVGVGAAVRLSEDGAVFQAVRIALGAVAPTPLYVQEAGEYLAGREVSPENIYEAARIAQAAARPINDMRGTVEQRRHLCMVLTRRALNAAVTRARSAADNGHSRSTTFHDPTGSIS